MKLLFGAALALLLLPLAAAGAEELPPLVVTGADGALTLPLQVRHDKPPHAAFVPEQVENAAAAGATIPLWSAKIRDGNSGKLFNYEMVGQNPQALSATSVKTVIVPIIFDIDSITFDPTTADECSPTGSAVDMTLASPMFQDVDLTQFSVVIGSGQANGPEVGTGQFPGLFQTANFSQFTNPGGFSFTLKPKVLKGVKVPVRGARVESGGQCGALGFIELTRWDNYVQTELFRRLQKHLKPTEFPLFLFYNVVMFDQNFSNCCILGYHSAFNNPNQGNAPQTYGVADYDTTNSFRGQVLDTSVMSHEIDEWQDDPFVNNATPKWGHIGQVSGCQANLEVGDPLSGTIYAFTSDNGFTYHVQDLAFFSWFFHQSPSIGAGGVYSLFGTFTSPAAACP